MDMSVFSENNTAVIPFIYLHIYKIFQHDTSCSNTYQKLPQINVHSISQDLGISILLIQEKTCCKHHQMDMQTEKSLILHFNLGIQSRTLIFLRKKLWGRSPQCQELFINFKEVPRNLNRELTESI